MKDNTPLLDNSMLQSFVNLIAPATAYNELLKLLTKKFAADRCQIIVRDVHTGDLEVRAVSPVLEAIDFSRTILTEAMENNKSRCIDNAVADPILQGRPSIDGIRFLTVIVVPLHDEAGQVIGALYLDRRNVRYGPFDTVDVDEVEEIADLLAPILIRQESLEKLRIQSEIQNLGIFVGNSRKMQRLYGEIQEAAAVDSPVYIFGETGTGKELAATALHKLSQRSDHSFIPVNCSAVPHELFESELFGHQKGAFTGASEKRSGKFQLANRGTLFLDEIADLPLDIQPKLLRVIQDGKIWPLGSEKAISVDVRIVVATNKDLEAEVAAGRFREDLYYRLNVLKIVVPPLRDRKEDIPQLAYHFLDLFSQKYDKNVVDFTDNALTEMRSRPWPGNVRQLENTIAKAVIRFGSRQALARSDIFPDDHLNNAGKIPAQITPDSFATFDRLDDLLRTVETEAVRRQLIANEWNKLQTATDLDIGRPRLDGVVNRVIKEALQAAQWDFEAAAKSLELDHSRFERWTSRLLLSTFIDHDWQSEDVVADLGVDDVMVRSFKRMTILEVMGDNGWDLKRAGKRLKIPRKSLQEICQHVVDEELSQNRGNRTQTARLLGMPLNRLADFLIDNPTESA